MKRAMNAGYILLKGKNRVKGEFGLIALTYNIEGYRYKKWKEWK